MTGNQDFGSYNSINTMSGFDNIITTANISVWGPERMSIPTSSGGEGKNWNVGLDFSLLDNRIYGSLNYFNRTQQDLLGNYNVPVPPNIHESTFVNVGNNEEHRL